MNNIVQSSS